MLVLGNLLLAELLAGPRLLFFELYLDVANNHSLHLLACISVLETESGAGRRVQLDLASERSLRIADVELVGMGGRVHHKLLRFEIVCFCDKIRNDVRVLRQQCLVIYLLPLEPLPKLLRCLTWLPHSGKAKVLQVQVVDEVKLPI